MAHQQKLRKLYDTDLNNTELSHYNNDKSFLYKTFFLVDAELVPTLHESRDFLYTIQRALTCISILNR